MAGIALPDCLMAWDLVHSHPGPPQLSPGLRLSQGSLLSSDSVFPVHWPRLWTAHPSLENTAPWHRDPGLGNEGIRANWKQKGQERITYMSTTREAQPAQRQDPATLRIGSGVKLSHPQPVRREEGGSRTGLPGPLWVQKGAGCVGLASLPVRTCVGNRAQRPLPPRSLLRWDAGKALCRLLFIRSKPCKRS